jgi:hypothetical protein
MRLVQRKAGILDTLQLTQILDLNDCQIVIPETEITLYLIFYLFTLHIFTECILCEILVWELETN